MSDPDANRARAALVEIGGYQLLERVGVGAMGEVFRARDTVHGRTVAIKRIPSELAADAAWSDRLCDLASSLSTLSHPGVAMLYECGHADGEMFLAQEYVTGQTLTALLAGRPLNPRRAVELAIEAADALAFVHAGGHVHGDLRPDNLVITQKGHLKLLDTGLARFTSGGTIHSTASARLGSLTQDSLAVVKYLAPEQAVGEGGDARSDLFALGLLLYEMLTGRSAFDRPSADDTLLAIVSASVPPPSTGQPNVPRELDAIVARALAKPVDQRYQTAAAFADDLRAVKVAFEVDSEEEPLPEFDEAPTRSRLWWWVLGLIVLGGAITWSVLRSAS